jgi:hypothetical protein
MLELTSSGTGALESDAKFYAVSGMTELVSSAVPRPCIGSCELPLLNVGFFPLLGIRDAF